MKNFFAKLDANFKNILLLGWVSLFTDFATNMTFPLLPIFLDKFLHATKTEIGFIEGISLLVASLLRVFSGTASDKLGKRKPLALLGYGLSSLTKPLLYLANSWTFILFIKSADMVGKGIRTPPRDALISGYSDKTKSGKSFGLHKSMDTFGALLGILTAFLLLMLLGEIEKSFRLIFLLSVVPGLVSTYILIFLVKEPPPKETEAKEKVKLDFKLLPKDFYKFLVIQTLFTVVAMNYTFLILKANYLGVAIGFIPLTYLIFNVFYFGFSYLMGDLADKFGKIKMMSVIYLLLSITAFIFTLNGSIWGWIGFIVYGIFMAGFQTVSAAVISDFTNEKIKGTAYGIYHTTIGLASFASLVLAGFLWDRFGANVPFYITSVVSIILSIALKILFSFKRDRKLEVSSES